jgi:hypothetical protein
LPNGGKSLVLIRGKVTDSATGTASNKATVTSPIYDPNTADSTAAKEITYSK